MKGDWTKLSITVVEFRRVSDDNYYAYWKRTWERANARTRSANTRGMEESSCSLLVIVNDRARFARFAFESRPRNESIGSAPRPKRKRRLEDVDERASR